MRGVKQTLTGELTYLSHAPERHGAERGRESFRLDVHPDGCRVLAAHCEIDDAPPVVRDVNLRFDPDGQPAECFVRIAVGGAFRGSGWFCFSDSKAQCEALTTIEGRVSQSMALGDALPGFGNHAIVNDGYAMRLYDRTQGPGTQVIQGFLLSSPDHRGATGPMLFAVDLAIEYHGTETITVGAGTFDALRYSIVDVPGMPEAHPRYDLWTTADDLSILLKAQVGGYMQTYYELTQLNRTGAD